MQKLADRFTGLFPVWVTLGGVIAMMQPRAFEWFDSRMVVWTLGLVMLGMGLTLKVEDFRDVLKMPRAIAVGFVAQYMIMPFMGWLTAMVFKLPPALAAGVILVSCCPGGTASNIVTYLARGNVALSVLMTMCSTFAAVVMTPWLTGWLAGKYVPVDKVGLLLSTVQVVLIPLILGLAIHHFFPRQADKVLIAAPPLSVLGVALICASIIGQNSVTIRESGLQVLGSVFFLHTGGFGLGYGFARLFGYDRFISRTISIEVGMQNSGLGVVLARKHFVDASTGTCLAAVPCAISSVMHSVIGSALAAFWRSREARREANRGV